MDTFKFCIDDIVYSIQPGYEHNDNIQWTVCQRFHDAPQSLNFYHVRNSGGGFYIAEDMLKKEGEA